MLECSFHTKLFDIEQEKILILNYQIKIDVLKIFFCKNKISLG